MCLGCGAERADAAVSFACNECRGHMQLPGPPDLISYWTISRDADGTHNLKEWVVHSGIPFLNHEIPGDTLEALHALLPSDAHRVAGPPGTFPPEEEMQEILLEVWRPAIR